MRPIDFTRRLSLASNEAGLTVADLSNWFDRPYHTVKRWVEGSTVYQDRRLMEDRLELLEVALMLNYFPLANVKQKYRAVKVRDVYRAIERRRDSISQTNTPV